MHVLTSVHHLLYIHIYAIQLPQCSSDNLVAWCGLQGVQVQEQEQVPVQEQTNTVIILLYIV